MNDLKIKEEKFGEENTSFLDLLSLDHLNEKIGLKKCIFRNSHTVMPRISAPTPSNKRPLLAKNIL